MDKNSKIYVAGHNGMVGSAIVRKLKAEGYSNFVERSSAELDLRDQRAVHEFFEKEKPEYVFLAAAKVGGIHANNTYRADFIYDNLAIEANVLHAAWENKVEKLLFLASSCIYPREAPQPIKEEYVLTGPLEPTNRPYAVAKLAGYEMCESYRSQYGCNFITAMPTNLYGPNDNYDLENSHVLPALLRKFYEAKDSNASQVEIWGSGAPKREFLHVDDMAAACYFLMENHNEGGLVNVGTGEDLSIKELAEMIKDISGYAGELTFNTSRPDGMPRKLLDVSKIRGLGWKHTIDLRDGIMSVYENLPNELERFIRDKAV